MSLMFYEWCHILRLALHTTNKAQAELLQTKEVFIECLLYEGSSSESILRVYFYVLNYAKRKRFIYYIVLLLKVPLACFPRKLDI